MTKEELYALADGSINFHDAEEVIPTKYLDEFFSQNVVIPKGKNRHSQADVWHEYLEDTTKKLEALEYGVWKESGLNSGIPYRIKPQEVYEWQWYDIDRNSEVFMVNSGKFMTEDEAGELTTLGSMRKFNETKRVRKETK